MRSKIELVSFNDRRKHDNIITISPLELDLISEIVPSPSHLMCSLIESQFRDANFYCADRNQNTVIDYKKWITYNWDVLNRFCSDFSSLKNQYAYSVDDETFKFIVNNCGGLYLFLRQENFDTKYVNEHFKEIENGILNLENYLKSEI